MLMAADKSIRDDRYGDEDTRLDLADIFPEKGDPRRPPEWLGRALLYAVIAVFAAIFVWNSWGKVSDVLVYIVISLFIAFAMEPAILILVRHGWKRSLSTIFVMVVAIALIVGFMVALGSMLVEQLIAMISSIPSAYSDLTSWVHSQFGVTMPSINDLGYSLLKSFSTNQLNGYANQALSATAGIWNVLLGLLTVLLVTYYIAASGPRMRQTICKWLPERTQSRFIVVWTVFQNQISGFLYSRIILAIISAACMSVFLIFLNVPYWLPLSIFCGLVSQFVPTVGTYIGGALPVISAWGSVGIRYALYILIYIVVYQQIENFIFQPAISQRTMDVNPAIAFVSVLAGAGLFGALGGFLALPVVASFQALFVAYARSYELIDSDLLDDPKPAKKSVLVQGIDAVSESVINPIASKLPRTSRGSSTHVTAEEIVRLRQEVEEATMGVRQHRTMQEEDESATVAITKDKTASSAKAPTPAKPANPKHHSNSKSGSPREEWK